MEVNTNAYRHSSAAYARSVMTEWATRWWWTLALPLCAFIFAGMHDWRWWIAGMALIMIIYPGILAMIYYYYALSPEAARAILPQTAQFGADGIKIEYLPLNDQHAAPAPTVLPYSEIKDWEDAGTKIMLEIKNQRYVKIEIPFSAFKSRDDSTKAVEMLQNAVSDKNCC